MNDNTAPDQEKMGGDGNGEGKDVDWLKRATSAHQQSTDYVSGFLRNVWEKNLKNFQSQHPSGSKYNSDDYKARSKVFRPKTRAVIRRAETAAAQAFFSTSDVVSIKPHDDDEPVEQASAAVGKELLQYRLTKTIPWFLTCIGAYQDTQVYGVCASYQWWQYEERQVGEPRLEPVLDEATGLQQTDENGTLMFDEVSEYEAVLDKPRIDLFPPENIRLDVNCDWRDPIQSSTFLIIKWPMPLVEVRDRMRARDGKTGQPQWKEKDEAEVRKARIEIENEATKTTRDQKRGIGNNDQGVSEYELIDIRQVFMRHDGEDMVYWTLGDLALLTDPVTLDEAYPYMGERPYTMGYSTIEAHKTYPAGKAEMIAPLQMEVNEVTNLRLDNSKLAMTGRFFVKRGRNVDLPALMRSVPGGIVLMNDPAADVQVVRSAEIPASSFQEVDRLNVDLDDLAGAFSSSSVQANRNLNETVGGMNILSNDAGSVSEYELRVFTETWVEPTLRQLLRLIQAYETDETILGLAGKKANLFARFGIDEITDDLLMRDMILTVNVGIGATNPMQQLQKFEALIGSITKLIGPQMAQTLLNLPEIIEEMFGKAGYKDGARFFNFPGDDPKLGQFMAIIQQLQQQLQTKAGDQQAKHQGDMELAQFNGELQKTLAQIKANATIGAQEVKNSGAADQAVIRAEGQAVVEEIIHRSDMHGRAMDHSHDINHLLVSRHMAGQPPTGAPQMMPPGGGNLPPDLASRVAMMGG